MSILRLQGFVAYLSVSGFVGSCLRVGLANKCDIFVELFDQLIGGGELLLVTDEIREFEV